MLKMVGKVYFWLFKQDRKDFQPDLVQKLPQIAFSSKTQTIFSRAMTLLNKFRIFMLFIKSHKRTQQELSGFLQEWDFVVISIFINFAFRNLNLSHSNIITTIKKT